MIPKKEGGETMIRLQKYLSDCGICSRRKAEYYIANNYITVNGEKVTVLGTKINPAKDVVLFQQKRVNPRSKHYYMILNKPEGYTCTMAEHKSEKNLSSLLPKVHHLYPVGRLDRDSEGLLILTTDGDFAQKIMHPKNKCEKEYFVIVIGNVLDGDLVKMQKGMLVPLEEKGDIKKKMARVKSASIIKRETGRSYISIVLEEGQKRQIRRMFQHLGFPVQYLKRVRIGQISLDKLPLGKSRDLTPREINSLIA
ncbi:MAG: pseudouridine synthase [Candidatus Peregrinibacteria bacterium]|nr:pseudouridine synthase [Candidatus Peregrinibacteria bacterium]